MSLFREKIPVTEHKELLAKATEAGRTNLVAFATAAKVEAVEEKTDAELVEAITAALSVTATLADENNSLEASIKQAEAANATLTSAAADAKAKATAAENKVEAVAALFGEAAKADDFDVVKAVGDIAPESFTASIENEDPTAHIPADIKSPLDELNAKFQNKEISASEFHKQAMAL